MLRLLKSNLISLGSFFLIAFIFKGGTFLEVTGSNASDCTMENIAFESFAMRSFGVSDSMSTSESESSLIFIYIVKIKKKHLILNLNHLKQSFTNLTVAGI